MKNRIKFMKMKNKKLNNKILIINNKKKNN